MALGMAKVFVLGNLVREPEASTAKDKDISNFALAVNEHNDKVSFFDCVAFGKTASFANEYLVKGSKVVIEGTLRQDRWEQDGKTRTRVKILVDRLTKVSFDEKKG